MNILQVSHSFYPCYQAGGVVKVVFDMSRALAKRGHMVTVISTDGCTQRLELKTNIDVNVEGIQVWYFRNISNFLRIKFKIATPYLLPFFMQKNIKNFDIIHVHEHRTILAIITNYFAKKYDIPYIVQAHGDIVPSSKWGFRRFIFDFFWGNQILKNAKLIIAVTDVEMENLIAFGIPKEKILVIPNTIDLSFCYNLPEYGTFKKKHNIPRTTKIILYVGRIHQRKRIKDLVSAYDNVRKQRKNLILIIAGSDDGYQSIIERQINNLNIKDCVLLTGYISEKEKIEAYTDASLLVYPGINEIFGLVPFECLMCGTPIIVSDDSGCGELIKKANCGYLIKFDSIKKLEEQIIHVIDNSKEAGLMIESGKAYINNNLIIEKVIPNIETMYTKIVTDCQL